MIKCTSQTLQEIQSDKTYLQLLWIKRRKLFILLTIGYKRAIRRKTVKYKYKSSWTKWMKSVSSSFLEDFIYKLMFASLLLLMESLSEMIFCNWLKKSFPYKQWWWLPFEYLCFCSRTSNVETSQFHSSVLAWVVHVINVIAIIPRTLAKLNCYTLIYDSLFLGRS